MNKSKRINGSKSSCIAVLDVGSTKVACFIGQIIDDKEDNDGIQVRQKSVRTGLTTWAAHETTTQAAAIRDGPAP